MKIGDLDALKKAINDAYEEYDSYDPHDLSRFAERVDDLIDSAPAAPQTQIAVFTESGNKEELEQELQRVLDEIKPQGEWVKNKRKDKYECAKCGAYALYKEDEHSILSFYQKLSRFCPNCGAKMKRS